MCSIYQCCFNWLKLEFIVVFGFVLLILQNIASQRDESFLVIIQTVPDYTCVLVLPISSNFKYRLWLILLKDPALISTLQAPGLSSVVVNIPFQRDTSRPNHYFEATILSCKYAGNAVCSAGKPSSPWASGVGRYHLGWIILMVIFV